MKNKKNNNKKSPEIFKDYFEYHNPLFLRKDLFKANLDGNEKIASWVSNLLIDLKNDVEKKILKMKIKIKQSVYLKNSWL